MASYVWVGTTADASVASNWSPATVPGASDTAIFSNSAVCTWNIASIDTIQVRDSYTGILEIATDVAITGLEIGVSGIIDASAARVLTFTGTPPYNSSKTHIYYNYATDDSPFRSETARGYLTFTMNGTDTITYDSGIYPHLNLTNGNHTPDYLTITSGRTNQIKYLSLTVASGVGFAPASATPSANDRLRKWISETSAASQFAISCSTFDGGYAEWTFQAHSSGFAIPTSGVATYNECKFTFDKMVIDASVGGVGKWAQIIAPSRLILTDFTVNVGASVKGSSTSTGCAILLVNKPTIHGTWAFLPVSDGYYVYPKIGETLGYPNGGTGLTSLGTANQVLAVNAGATAMEWQTVSGGGGSGTVTSIATTAPITGGTITTSGTIGISAATTSAAGSMSSADKTKLDGIATGATAYADADAIAAVEGTSSLDLTGDLTLDTSKKIIMDEKTYASASASSGTIELTAEKTGSNKPLLTLRTPSGYLRMGPQNNTFCHFYTDRDYFYFNKPIQMDNGAFYSYDEDLQIKTDDSTSGQPTRIYIDAGIDACRVGIGNGFTSSNLPATELEVAGTIRQSNATSAVLVADSNGDLTAASNLTDDVFVQAGSAGQDPFSISAPGAPTDWAGAPPNTIEEAINRLAAWAQTAIPGPIP